MSHRRITSRRGRPPQGLNPRAGRVLGGVVRGYLRSGEPVGSSDAVRFGRLRISPATVRVVMAELTAGGLLTQPHTSAGRIPTQAGFRVYVDHLMRARRPSEEARDALEARLEVDAHSPRRLIQAASRHLAVTCAQTAFGRRPRLEHAPIRRLELLPLTGGRCVAILVLGNGVVIDRVLEVDPALGEVDFVRAANLFNERWVGSPLNDARRRLRSEIETAETGDPALALLQVAETALKGPDVPEDAVVVEGRTHLLVSDDVGGDMAPIVSALEDKRLLLELLEGIDCDPGQGPRVLFGEETQNNALRQCTVVAASYGFAENRMGTVAIIGPVRMDYARIVPWVGCTADAISGILVKRHVAA